MNIFIVGSLILSIIILYKIRKKNLYKIAFYSSVRIFKTNTSLKKQPTPLHIFICIADHFEPGYGAAPLCLQKQRVDTWIKKFPELAKKHRDSTGNPPRHTWFFPPHYDIDDHLKKIVRLCKDGLGEIELHFHHNRIDPFPDTEITFTKKIQDALHSYARFGIFPLLHGKQRFCFVHGDWALDNSRGSRFCGINNELQILSSLGCYADFTFPSLCQSQPASANSIYYAKDNPLKPKSYNTGIPVKAGGCESGDLMIIQGILGLRWTARPKTLFLAIENSDISNTNMPTQERIDYWIKNAISIQGRPDCKFIKLHTHGAWEGCMTALLDEPYDTMCTYLEKNYNDGKKYKLYYVTSREMYNMIKAIEADAYSDFHLLRDFIISKPNYYL